MMTRKVSTSSIKPSLLWFRRLAVALVLLFAAQGVWGFTYIWTGNAGTDGNGEWNTPGNWTSTDGGTSYPTTADTVYIINGATITLTANTIIQNLKIANNDNTATLDLTNHTLTINGTLNLGTENDDDTLADYRQKQGKLKIRSDSPVTTVSINTFDLGNYGDNYLYLETIACNVTGTYWANGPAERHSILTGNATSTFVHPYPNTEHGDNSVVEFQGEMAVGETGNPIFKVTTTDTPAPGATVNITITATGGNFSQIYYKATRTGNQEYTINSNPAAYGTLTQITFPETNSTSISLGFPSSIGLNEGIILSIYSANNELNLLKQVVSYTQTNDTTNWTGADSTHPSDWNVAANWDNGVPADGMKVVIPSGSNYPEISVPTNNLNSLSIQNGAQITVASGGTLNATTISNSGTITLDGGSIDGTPEITLTGGTIDSTGHDITIGEITILDGGTIKADNINLTENISSSGALSFVGQVNADSGIEIAATSVLSFTGLVSASGDVTLTAGTKIDFSSNITATGHKIIVDAPVLNSTIASGDVAITAGTLELKQALSLQSDNSPGITLAVSSLTGSEYDFTNKVNLTLADEIAVDPDFINTNSASLTCAGDATFKSDLDLSDLSTSAFTPSTGTITLSAEGKTPATLSGEHTFQNLTLSGAVNVSDDITVNGELKLTGTDAVSFSGSNTIGTFTADGLGGKTITFGSGTTQTITDTLTLTGASDTNRLALKSSTDSGKWIIDCSDSNPTLKNLTVTNSTNSNINSLSADESIDGGGNTNWVFLGVTNGSYEWTGNTSDWNTSANWEPAAIPVTGAVITIPAGCSNYPVLPTGGVNLGNDGDPSTEYGTITIASGASLNFNGQPLTAKSITNNGEIDFAGGSLTVTTITNNGTVYLLGTETITGTMNNGANSTVEYYGSETTFDFVWDGSSDPGKQYANLIINRPVTQLTSSGNQLIVSGTTTISNTTGEVKINNSSNEFTGSVTISSGGSVTLGGNSTKTITIANGAYATNLTVESPVKLKSVATINGNQEYNSTVTINDTNLNTLIASDGAITFNDIVSGSTEDSSTNSLSVQANNIYINCDSITTAGVQSYTGAVTLEKDVELITSNNTSGITFSSTESTINSKAGENHSLTLNIPAGKTAVFEGEVGTTTALSSITITRAGNVTFNKEVKTNAFEITQADAVEFKEAVNSSTFNITQATSTTFDKAVTIGEFTDETTAGAITFDGGGTISNAVTFNTSDDVSIKGTQTVPMNIGTAPSYANLKHENGATSINGYLNAAVIQLGTTNITNGNITTATSISAGAVTIGGANTTTITTTGAQSYTGNFKLDGNAALSSTADGDISFGSTITGTKLLTLTVPTTNDIAVTGTVGDATNKPSVRIMQAGSTTFTGSVNLTSFEDDTNHNGSITFSNGGTIADNVTFNTIGSVSITGPMNIISGETYKNLTHENGDTSITGTLNAAEITLGTSAGASTGTTTITSGVISGSKFEVGNLEAAGTITTSGEQKYNGTVELTNGLTLKSNSSSITFAQTITGTKALSVDSSTGTSFGDNVGTSTNKLASLTVTGPSTIGCSNIYTSGAQTYDGAVVIGTDTTLTSTGNDIWFKSTVNGHNKLLTLSVPENTTTPEEHTYSIKFDDQVGESDTNRPKILIVSAGTVNFAGIVKASEFTINKANETVFNETVTIGTFSDDLLTPEDNGTITFKKGGTIADNVTFNTIGSVSITGPMNIISGETYKNLTHENGVTSITGTLNAAEITLGTSAGASTGTTTITGGVINASKFEVGNLEAAGTITTTGEQKYNGTVKLTGALTLESTAVSGDAISFVSTITGGQALSVKTKTGSNGTIFGGNVGTLVQPITSLTVTGPSTIGCSNIYTSGAQSFGGDVTLGEDTTLTAGGNISFGSAGSSAKIDGNHTISLSVPNNATNTITVTGAVGSDATTTSEAPSVTITQAGKVTFKDTVKANNFTITKANSTTFDKAVTIGEFTDETTAGAITFDGGGTISNAGGTTFKTSGNVSFTGTDSTPMTFGTTTPNVAYANLKHENGATSITGYLNAAEITLGTSAGTSTGTTTITSGVINASKFEVGDLEAAGTITTSGEQKYNGTVELTGGLTLESTVASGTAITFASTIAGEQALSVKTKATSYGTSFGGNVGSQTQPIASLTVTGPSTIGCSNIYTSGAQSYSGAVVLGADTEMKSNNASITFASTIDSATGTNHSLSLDAKTGTTFNGPIGNTTNGVKLSVLDVKGKATITSDCTQINTTKSQTYNDDVEISSAASGSVSLTADTEKITFKKNVSLGKELSVTANGSEGGISFTAESDANANANVYGNNQLTLTAGSNAIVFTATAGTQANKLAKLHINSSSSTTFAKAVYIGEFTDETTAGAITFKHGGTILSDTEIHTSQNVTLTDTLALPSLQMNNLIVDGTADINTTSSQTYKGTINGKTAETDVLNLKSDSGTITFKGNIGGALPLKTLSIVGQSSIDCSAITTSGAQNYSGEITLSTTPTPHTLTASSITFDSNSTINGGAALALVTTTTSGTSFGANIGGDTPLTSLTVTGPATIGCSNISTFDSQSFGGDVRLGADTALTAGGNISFGSKIDGNHTISLSVPNNATNTITVTGAVGSTASTTATAPSVTITQAGTVTFKDTVKAHNFTIAKANSTTFEKAVEIAAFADDDTNHTGTITFKKGAAISAATVIHTQGAVTLTETLTVPSLQMNNLIVDKTANITTTGAQIYEGTINGKTASTDILNLDSGTGHITFNGNIGQSLPPLTLNVNGETTINCAAIKTSGSQTYNNAITLGTTPAPDTHTLTASGVSFVSTIDGAANFAIVTTAGTSFGADVGASTPPATLTVTGPSTIACDEITTSGDQHYKNEVVLTASPTLTSTGGNLSFDSTIDGAYTITLDVPHNPANTITVAGKVGETSIPSVAIAQAGTVSFAQTVKAEDFTITTSNDTTFAKAVNITDFKITTADTTTFEEVVQISTFTDAATAGDITFANGGTISSATVFKTAGTVTLGDSAEDTMNFGTSSYANLTHVDGDTSITGILNAAEITLAQTSGGPMTITNTGLFKTVDGAALTYTTSFAQNGQGNSVLGGSFTGNGNATFATDVQLYGSAQADFGSSGKNVSIAKNLIIIREATDDLNINSNVSVTQNLVLYKGPVVADGNITVGRDILVLGSAYSEEDTTTGITDEYSYYCVRPEGWSQPNYEETNLPDGTACPSSSFSSTLSVSSGKSISAAKNFYSNGTTLSLNGTSGQWILKLPDLTNAANAFAEAYHSEIAGCKVVCNAGGSNTEDGTRARLVCLECTDTGTTDAPNTNVDFDDFEITAAYTERDNSIRVEFNRPVRYYSQTVETLKFFNEAGAPACNFTGLYSDSDCQNPIEYDTLLSYFYIKAAPQDDSQYGAWNTDATGRSSGADDNQSTDRSGIHHETIPALDFARALVNNGTTQAFIFTDRWGKRLNNYSQRVTKGSGAQAAYGSTADTQTAHEVADKTGPVLYSVRTGQELHSAYNTSTGQASEHSYDSHNFIEFLYSEKVDFDGDAATNAPLNADPSTAENVQVTDSFGALNNTDITTPGALTIAGLGTIQNGLLYTGSAGSTNKYVNALYRTGSSAEYSIRLSIAGYTDGTVTDPDGNTYKKWIGYIEQAQMPTGTITHLVDSNRQNTFVKDKDGNPQEEYPYAPANTIPSVDSTEDGLYGAWDLSEPVFAPVRPNKKTTAWNLELFQKNYSAEAVGNNSGVGSTLDRIEFHLYDNTPEFDAQGNAAAGTPEWFSEVGWCVQNSEGEKATDLYKSYTYAADIFGGARPYDSDTQRRTSGGIRYSTLHSAVAAFKYGISSGATLSENLIKTSFDNSKNTWDGASSLVFTGSSSPRRSAGDLEGLYFALPLANTSLDIKTSFTVKYDDTVGFITDLAGNRLRTKIISTIDRTPPSIDMTVCPVGGDELEIIFVKQLCVDSEDLHFVDNDGNKVDITETFNTLVNKCFDFITINSSGQATVVSDLKIKEDVPAQISVYTNQNGSSFTSMRFKLSRTVTLEDIEKTFIRVTCIGPEWESSTDKFTGHPGSRVTFIQDVNETGNNLQMYTAHALSDFAVGIINPLYAYDSAMTEDDGTIISDSLFRTNLTDDVDSQGWSVHDWNRDQTNYGTLPAKRPVAIVADTSDGTETNENAPSSFRLYLANNPDAASVSTQYNKDLEPVTQWRIWLPNEMTGVFTSLAEANNKNYSKVDGTLLSDDNSSRLIFDVDKVITNLWSAGNQITFLFGLTNSDGSPVTIMHSPELDINNDKQYLATSAKMPLFALRQTDSQDLMSLDLWSFRLKDNVSQRGGVTIMNNVIDAAAGEKVVVKVDVPEQGNLTVLVMTLDGNIVDYLHRGTASQGEHFYSWDGTNRKGTPVARGMYFIRVSGPGLDETRKVMVVKE